jgi:PUA-domain protein
MVFMKQVQLRSKEVNKKIEQYKIVLSKKDKCILIDKKIILVNNIASFFYYQEKLLPTLHTLQEHSVLKKITVDMGAIKFVIGGADIMRPGITDIQEGIEKGEEIVIIDETNKKPLAIGIALFDTKTMQEMSKGKVIQNIHYVGDEIWKTKI